MAVHSAPREKITEVWGLRLPDGRVLTEGYSGRSLGSAADVRGDFARDQGYPVLISRTVTTTFIDITEV